VSDGVRQAQRHGGGSISPRNALQATYGHKPIRRTLPRIGQQSGMQQGEARELERQRTLAACRRMPRGLGCTPAEHARSIGERTENPGAAAPGLAAAGRYRDRNVCRASWSETEAGATVPCGAHRPSTELPPMSQNAAFCRTIDRVKALRLADCPAAPIPSLARGRVQVGHGYEHRA